MTPSLRLSLEKKGSCTPGRSRDRNGSRERLAEVTKEVNRTRQRLRRAYFSQRLEERVGDARTTWEVLGEVLGGRKKKG
jgi:hypothetical protein